MANTVEFEIPAGISPQDVARTLRVYFLGSLIFDDLVAEKEPILRGESRWQLDDNNDYWLSVEGTKATLECRYPGGMQTIQVMCMLFKLLHYTDSDQVIGVGILRNSKDKRF